MNVANRQTKSRQPRNTYRPKYAKIWLSLIDYGDGQDLDIETVCPSKRGWPKWLKEEASNSGLEMMLNIPDSKGEESGLGWTFYTNIAQWARKQGLAPGQNFLVQIDEPKWYRCSYEYDEWDCDFYAGIIAKAPITVEEAAARWDQFDKTHGEYKEKAIIAMKALLEKRKDKSVMYIQHGMYFSDHYYDEMAYPSGVSLRLCSPHHQVEGFPFGTWNDLGDGRDDKGDRDLAKQRLLEYLQKNRPELEATMEWLDSLPTKW